MEFRIINGDCRVDLRPLAESSVDSVVTDPPYDLTANKKGGSGIASVNLNTPQGRARITTGFMGKAWDGTGVAFDPATWVEVLRVLKPGGQLLAFGGTRTYHRMVCAIEDAGFEIRDQIQWIYGSGFPKSLDVSKAIDAAVGIGGEWVRQDHPGRPGTRVRALDGTFGDHQHVHSRPNNPEGLRHIYEPTSDAAKQWEGWGTALKPAHEPIVLARKPLIGTVAENMLRHGTGALNIDACRIEGAAGSGVWGSSNQTCQEGRTFNRSPNGEEYRSEQNTLGRWPANVIHDGSPEVLATFPDAPGQMAALNGSEPSRPAKNVYGEYKDRREFEPRFDSGSAARFFYCAKTSKEDREEGLESLPLRSAGDVTDRRDGSDGLNSPRAGAGRVNGSRNHHPTVKPTDLMRYLCRLITPPGGTVLDPFCGSGSTGKAAMLEGLNFIGVELDPEYCELAEKRIKAATKQGLLW